MVKPTVIRISPDLLKKINIIRAKCIMSGRKPPSISKITEKMAQQIKEELIWSEFIKF